MVTRRGWRPSGRGIPTNAAGFVRAVVLTVLAVFACLPSLAFAEGPSAEFRLEGSVPATVRGEPSNQSMLAPFGPGAGEYACKPPPFAAGIPKGVEEAGGTVFGTVTSEGEQAGTCYPESNPVPLEMNGCQITFEPGEPLTAESTLGTIKMGPVGCGPIISQAIYSCQLELSPNSWQRQTVEFRNIGSGPEGTVQVLAQLAGMEEKLEGPYFCPDGSYEADWTINWTLRAEDESFQPRGLAVINPAAGTPPSAVTEPATDAKAASATLHAAVNPNGSTTSYQFQYGTTTEYGSAVPASVQNVGSGVQEVAVSQTPAGLAEETLYHYRVVAENSAGTTYGSDRTFSTLHLPEARTEGASEVRAYRATLNGTVNPQGGETSYYFEYGTTQSYGHTTGGWPPLSGSSDVAVEKSACCDLEPDTTYHYRLVAESQAGKSYGEDETFTTETAPQTTITSPTPSFTSHERWPVEFSSDKSGSSFKCSLDGSFQACESPYVLPERLEGWHTFEVEATDAEGNLDLTPARWKFNTSIYPPAPATSKLVYPEEGKKTASYYTLEAEWGAAPEGGGVTGVEFQMQLPEWEAFKNVPAECVIDGEGKQVSWPLPTSGNPGHTEPVFLKVKGCAPFVAASYPEKEVKFRAAFDGGEKAAGASEAVTTEFIHYYDGPSPPTDAIESVGPASVDLLTGAFTISRTDVSIPVPGTEATLEFTRVYHSMYENRESFVMGAAWQPSAPAELEYEGEAWTSLDERVIPQSAAAYEQCTWNEETETESCTTCAGSQCSPCPEPNCEMWMIEEEQPEESWMELLDNEGAGISFEIKREGSAETYIAPDYAKELTLKRIDADEIALASPNGTRVTFLQNGSGDYLPKTLSFRGKPNEVEMVYEYSSHNGLILTQVVAPGVGGVTCESPSSTREPGCRTLELDYLPRTEWSEQGPTNEIRLASIRYYTAKQEVGEKVNESEIVAKYNYDSEARLIEEWDPRLPNPPEKYTYYPYTDLLTAFTPPGEEPWEFGYEYGIVNKLTSVSRPLEGEPPATDTIAYDVPVSGEGAPYEMGASAVAKWGESDFPVDATAVFPPNHVPGAYPPSDYSGATIHYMDPDGYEVNSASPSPPGVEGDVITTSETDVHGNVVRELSAQNRLEALEAEDPVARSHELDSHSVFSSDGTEMLESWGPLHQIRLESGEDAEAREHTTIEYDKGAPALKEGETAPRLPTKETVAAIVPGKEEELEPRVTETRYDWTLRKPTETIVDPQGLDLVSTTVYNESGQVVQERQPADTAGSTAGTTKTEYYVATGTESENPCYHHAAWAGLPCASHPAAEPSPGEANPDLPWTWYTGYSLLDQPTEVQERTAGAPVRTTTFEYDGAGRQLRTHVSGEGAAIPTVETSYDEATGAPVSQQFICEAPCSDGMSYMSSFGTKGTGNGQFEHPADAAADANGNLWVVDKANNRIEEFNEAGKFIRAAGSLGSGAGQLDSPSAITIDSLGDIDVTDTANNRVEQFSEAGEFRSVIGTDVDKTKVENGGSALERGRCTAWSGDVCQAGSAGSLEGEISDPIGITTTGGQNFFVVEKANDRVEKFNPQGELLAKFGSAGSGTAQFKEPTAIAYTPVGNIHLWVADTGNNRIQEWTSSYTYTQTVGKEGTANGEFNHPDAIDADAEGNVYVGDEGNERVQEFNASGTYLGKFGTGGTGAGQFNLGDPGGILLAGSGKIWVADSGNSRVQEWAPFDSEATRTTYDALGRPFKYEDADGNVAETTYDVAGRPAVASDGKGTQTYAYDEASGVLTELTDSAAGTFTATYNADGEMTGQRLPDGLNQKVEYDPSGTPIALDYVKEAGCSMACTWLSFSREDSIGGQVLREESNLGNHEYSYDKAGRLSLAKEYGLGGACTTRSYAFDADSNRTSRTTREPREDGSCDTTSEGSKTSYSYDTADRLIGEGVDYDDLGRITSLPAKYSGGGKLETSYYVNDLTHSQSQDGVTNAYGLDAALRQRERVTIGGSEAGAEIYHYAGRSDFPTWTEETRNGEATWTRNIGAIGDGLGALETSKGEVTLQLANMHGDVVATAAVNPEATELLATQKFDEFGDPVEGSLPEGGSGEYSWLGASRRRTQFASGVIQMGERSYVPAMGRFLTRDPIPGGSANAYDYANQDPINGFDLAGTCSSRRRCAAARHKARRRVHKSIARARSVLRRDREERAHTYIGPYGPGLGGRPPFTRPFEQAVGDLLNKAEAVLQNATHSSCANAGFILAGGGLALEEGAAGIEGMGPEAAEAGRAVRIVGQALGRLGFAVEGAHLFGLC